MNNVKSGLIWRVIWACFGVFLAENSLITFNATESYSSLISVVGWLFMATAWFMQPLVVTANLKLSEVKQSQAPYAIGPYWARVFFPSAGIALIVLGLILKLFLVQ